MEKVQAAQWAISPYHWETEVQNRALNSCSLRCVPPVSKRCMNLFNEQSSRALAGGWLCHPQVSVVSVSSIKHGDLIL